MSFKNMLVGLAVLFIFGACGSDVKPNKEELQSYQSKLNLNRVKGIRGENAPKITDAGVVFSIKVPEATLVTIAGNFNGWNDRATPLAKDKDGLWTITLPLKTGQKYQYKFVVDGFYIADPDNPDTMPDGFNGVNSVIEIKK